ncbi:MAG: agmatinase [Candidatus Thalassarchaeum sp.]|nr:agmatinase [Candidatus Thalassarchaeum sp.]MDP6920396.1 agmatinase [Candidatus Thalassarchaeum sp.]
MKGPSRPRFLGLNESDSGPWDIVVLPVPFEMTTSWGEGTEKGPAACIEASSQVELYDPMLPDDLPCGLSIHTAEAWGSEAGTLLEQLDSIRDYAAKWFNGAQFPVVLGGEHGILPPLMQAASGHPEIGGDLGRLTLVQVDAHADLRDELGGERFSHGTAVRRALDAGVGRVMQIGTRALSREEAAFAEDDGRVETWFARDFMGVCDGQAGWAALVDRIDSIEGPVWLTFDVDGLDGSLVPDTGTPVPGGLSHWGAVEILERLFASGAEVIGADVNEIVPGEDRLTQFNAALIATKIMAAHIASRG